MLGKCRLAALAVTILLAASCDVSVIPSAPPSTTPSPTAPPAQPIAFQLLSLPALSNSLDLGAFAPPHLIAVRMVQAALYRFDAALTPIPDLAAEPCAAADDDVTITCTLRPARFHDGSPVTADDVVYTYQLATSPSCTFFQCPTIPLERVEAIDTRTVRFTLTRPYAPFLTTGLGDVFIEPRALIERSYEAFAEQADTSDIPRLEAAGEEMSEALTAAEPDCEAPLDEAEAALAAVGVTAPDRAIHTADGRFNACFYAQYVSYTLGLAAESLRLDGIDAVAAAYALLPFHTYAELPVGAGPWRVREFDPETGIVLVRHDGYHHGAPVTPEVHLRRLTSEEAVDAALLDGSLDWRPVPPWRDPFEFRDHPSLRTETPPASAYRALQYNLRPGRLFADRNLRQAVELCIDKERIVRASTDVALPIYSFVPPGSWAYQPGLAKTRDVDAGRRLIEASGWSLGADGIYTQDGRRLAAQVVVRADFTDQIAALDRIALQVRACGIELTPKLVQDVDAFDMLEQYPHHVPGSSEPFDVYLGGWGLALDPDAFDYFHSSRVTSDIHSGYPYWNYIGFANAEADRLIEDGLGTYDIDARTEIYRRLQRLLAEEQPYLFLYAEQAGVALDADLTTDGAPLDFTSGNWWWQLEALRNPAE